MAGVERGASITKAGDKVKRKTGLLRGDVAAIGIASNGGTMTARLSLAAALGGLLLTMPAQAQQFDMKVTGPGHIAFGSGSTGEKLPDGRSRVSNGHAVKTCQADSLAVASSVATTVVTIRKTKRYPHGLAACFALADFGGEMALTPDNGLTLTPAPSPAP